MKSKFYRLCVWNPVSGLLQIDRKLEIWQWRHNFLTWRHRQIFPTLFCFSCNFQLWFKFHVNIITDSGVMTISLRDWNTPVWVLPNIWSLGQVKNTKFGTNVSSKMLLNATKCQGYSFTVSELLRENHQGVKLPRLNQIKSYELEIMNQNAIYICISLYSKIWWFPMKKRWCQQKSRCTSPDSYIFWIFFR